MRNTKHWHGAARLVELVLRRLHQLRRRLVLGLRLDEGRVLLLALLRGLPAPFCDCSASIAVAVRSHQVRSGGRPSAEAHREMFLRNQNVVVAATSLPICASPLGKKAHLGNRLVEGLDLGLRKVLV